MSSTKPKTPILPPDSCASGGVGSLSRRGFIKTAGAAAGLALAPPFLRSALGHPGGQASSLFTLGVASGDPGAHQVVLWTRLAPDPLEGGGMPRAPVPVRYEVATDEGMTNIIRKVVAVAHHRNGHAVNVLLSGLPSNRWLWYRFKALGETSRVGRTRTFPGRRDAADHMRFAVANCQNYAQGYYPAYRDMLDQDLDFVLHVGDYIYEGAQSDNPLIPGRDHLGAEIFTVQDYRNRYALYRLDPDLQDAHARYPFIVTWDDHEVDNNYAGLVAEEGAPYQDGDFVIRRLNAYQVYSETMPLHPRARQHGQAPGMRLFRGFSFGDLADLHVLDTRQYRSDQPAGDNFGSTDPDSAALEPVLGEELFDAEGILDPEATLLGADQERWLARRLRKSEARWNIIGQQVMVMPWNLQKAARATIAFDPRIPPEQKQQLLAAADQVDNILNVDAWDGYPAARQRLLAMLDAYRPGNPVFVTGDIHSAWAANLLADFDDLGSDTLAVEFVSTAISSTFLAPDPRPTDAIVCASLPDNPHIAFFNGLFRGYTLCDVDGDRCKATYRAVGNPEDVASTNPLSLVPGKNAEVRTDAVFEVQAGFNTPGSPERLVHKKTD